MCLCLCNKPARLPYIYAYISLMSTHFLWPSRMAAQRESIKIYIPHPNQPELSICGVLEQYTPGIETKGRKLALVRAIATETLQIVWLLANEYSRLVQSISWLKFWHIRWHSCLTIDLTRDNGVSKILTCSASSLFSSAYTATAPYHWMKEISHSVLIPVLSILATRTICFNVVLRIVYWWTRSVSTSGTFFSYFLENPYSQRRRGNHETGGTWKQGALEEDLEDLNAVVAYLKSKYSYEIELVVGHSLGFDGSQLRKLEGRFLLLLTSQVGTAWGWVSPDMSKPDILLCSGIATHLQYFFLHLPLLSHGLPCAIIILPSNSVKS